MRYVISILFLLLSLPAQAGPDASILGDWYGVGIQSDGGEWDMIVSIEPDKAIIAYPLLECGGFWAYSDSSANHLSGVEYIVHGLEFCINQGIVRVQRYGNGQLLFYWCDSALEVSATAVLQHPDDGKTSYEQHLEHTLQALQQHGDSLSEINCDAPEWQGV